MTTRLRATGVHRAEFAPAIPLDFDANCAFAYHYSARELDNLACDSPLGDGHLRLVGSLPGNSQPKVSLELQRIPAQAILDALRTVRSEVGVGLAADGSLSGQLTYDKAAPPPIVQTPRATDHRGRKAANTRLATVVPDPLTGSIALDGFKLSGGSLTQPVQVQKVVLEPAAGADGQGEVLTGIASLPAGSPTPLVFTVHLTLSGYLVTMRGAGTPARVRQLAHAAGLTEAGALDAIAGDPVTVDLAIGGPWLPAPEEALAESGGESSRHEHGTQPARPNPTGSREPLPFFTTPIGRPSVLPTAVVISQATLHLSGGTYDWDPVAFVYGPLKGLARVQIPARCAAAEHCLPTVNLDFPSLDAAELQSALLGSEEKGTLLSTVIARLTPSSTHPWPALHGTLKAGSLVLGPVTLQSFAADLKLSSNVAEINAIDAGLLGGQIHITGEVGNGEKPSYKLEGSFQNLNAGELCRVLALKCTGAGFDGEGKLELAGYQGKDLATSAKGTLHFVWKKGGVAGRVSSPDATPPALAHFDSWTADADIAGGVVTLKDNEVQQGKRSSSANVSVTFAEPPKVTFVPAKTSPAPKK